MIRMLMAYSAAVATLIAAIHYLRPGVFPHRLRWAGLYPAYLYLSLWGMLLLVVISVARQIRRRMLPKAARVDAIILLAAPLLGWVFMRLASRVPVFHRALTIADVFYGMLLGAAALIALACYGYSILESFTDMCAVGFRKSWRNRQPLGTRDLSGSHCLHCGYDLRGSNSLRCPECGKVRGFQVDPEELGLTDEEIAKAEHRKLESESQAKPRSDESQ